MQIAMSCHQSIQINAVFAHKIRWRILDGGLKFKGDSHENTDLVDFWIHRFVRPPRGGTNSVARVLLNGMKAVLEDLRAQRKIGRSLGSIEYDTSTALRQRIQSGDAFDVAILGAGMLDDLIKSGKVTAASRTDLGDLVSALVFVPVRASDIKTPER